MHVERIRAAALVENHLPDSSRVIRDTTTDNLFALEICGSTALKPFKRLVSTVPESINSSGQVTGTFEDFNFIPRGFVRDRDGNIAAFTVGSAKTNSTFPISIGPKGVIAGITLT